MIRARSGRAATSRGMSRASLFVPLAVFAGLIVLLWTGFSLDDPHRLPSALLGKPFPSFALPQLDAPADTVTERVLQGRLTLVNVWASWCPTCQEEHAELTRIHDETGIPLIGVVYKDDPDSAKAWLARLGNPYERQILDHDGTLGIDLGVYGAPETFLVDARGVIVHKRVGDVNRQVWEKEFVPLIAKLSRTASVEGG